jgi:cation diffusion facilitator CzcD-associated flavoprotein CzcO
MREMDSRFRGNDMRGNRINMTQHTGILIIGGGLSGLTLAGVLARAGVDVTCIDRMAPPRK